MGPTNDLNGSKPQCNGTHRGETITSDIGTQNSITSMDEYNRLYTQSIHEPQHFWGSLARDLLSWNHDFHTTCRGSLANGDVSWFLGGELNACFNCVDRHALRSPDKTALIYISDDGTNDRSLTFAQLLAEVCRLAGALRALGVRKGDVVTIYLPMIPEAAIALLACARIGAVHSVVFAGFSADALADRIADARSSVLITADEGRRGGKTIHLKNIADEALAKPRCAKVVTSVLVCRHTGAQGIPWIDDRDHWWHEELDRHPRYIAPVPMAAEDPLFLLYTSGSTGKPKGIQHATGGYLVGAAATGKYVFGLREEDRLFCAGDVGWITGHTYVVYGPLALGVTTVVFEGTPVFPDTSRYWDIVDKHEVTHFYAAPTALRLLKRESGEHISPYPMRELRVLASVGEPIAPELWKWYHDVVGREKCRVVDTYWQTETGSHVIAPLAGITPTKPGAATLPFFGIEPVLLEPATGTPIEGNDVEGVLAFKQPWPSMARTVLGDHKRFMETYLNVYKGYYFTGDGAYRDADGYYWIRGRVDDVINVSGHRLSTAEIETALVAHPAVSEVAVVGVNDELTGQAVVAFISTAAHHEGSSDDGLIKELRQQIRRSIGPFAAPKRVVVVDDLPKTRSGKIMRRILRKIVAGEEDQLGDITTLADPSVVNRIIKIVHGR